MGFLRVAGFVVVVVLMAVFCANKVLIWNVAIPGKILSSGLHVVCRGRGSDVNDADVDVLFYHAEHGSSLQFLNMMEILEEQNISSCCFDRSGYGFSSGAVSLNECPFNAKVC
jgi:hypothetical protein